MRDAILDAAERRARSGGYYGFSFRDLAQDVDIKSASVHYHFATKDDLVAALAERYTERVRTSLGDPARLSARAAIRHVANVFLHASETDNLMCLCGMLAAESGCLPRHMRPKIAAFFEMMTAWLEVPLKRAAGAPKPIEVLAALEGGLLIARATENPAALRTVVNALLIRV
jgi:TetR/AcrR family transcriptional regulator, transcriptional repressor for nem operon